MNKIQIYRDDVIELIKNNSIGELKKYIKENNVNLKKLNNEDFDVLIFAIENSNSFELINFILNLCQYKTLNYIFIKKEKIKKYKVQHSNEFLCYKVPIFLALSKTNLKVANVLLKEKANINFTIKNFDGIDINVIQYLCKTNSLNSINLNYILRNCFSLNHISNDLINTLVNYQFKNNLFLLETIFKHFIFDNSFILKCLYFSKIKRPLSTIQLKEMVFKEETKILYNDTVYYNAIHEGNYEALKLLFNFDGSDQIQILNKIKKFGLLEMAIEEIDYLFVKKIINLKNFDFKYCNLENILLNVSKIGDLELKKLLLKSLISKPVNFENVDLKNILKEASRYNNYNYYNNKIILEFILEKLLKISFQNFSNIDISSIENNDVSYLSLLLNVAIKIGNFKLIQRLVEHKQLKAIIDINVKDYNNEYPIIMAYYVTIYYATEFNSMKSYINSLEIFQYLLNHGANCNEKDRDGNSLLLLAIQNKKYNVVKYLLKQNITLTKEDISEGYSLALINAIVQKKIEIIALLLNRNYHKNIHADIPLKSKQYGFTPLIFSYLLNYNDIFNLLLNYFDINELDYNGYSLLHYAILKDDLDTVTRLIKIGANINFVKDGFSRGNAPIDIAIDIKNKEILSILLNEKQLLLNEPNEWGEIPLMTIIESNNYLINEKVIIIKNLIQLGSNVNFIDRRFNSPLIYAIQEESMTLTKLLIDYGADVNIINKDGHSPLEYANQHYLSDISTLLLKNGAKPVLINN